MARRLPNENKGTPRKYLFHICFSLHFLVFSPILSLSLPPLPPSFCLIVCLFVCSFVSIFLSLYPFCSLFPKVIGDKKGGQTALLLDQLGDLSILGEIEQVVQVPMKFIHVHRNPFDNIAAITLRSTESRIRKERVKVSRRLIWSFFLYY